MAGAIFSLFTFHFSLFFVPFTLGKCTHVRKYSNKFGISLTFSYLCAQTNSKTL